MVKCENCNIELIKTKGTFPLVANGKAITVLKDVDVYICPNCPYEVVALPLLLDQKGLHVGKEK